MTLFLAFFYSEYSFRSTHTYSISGTSHSSLNVCFHKGLFFCVRRIPLWVLIFSIFVCMGLLVPSFCHNYIAFKFYHFGDLSGRGPGEKAMAPHSSTLAWKIPWMEEPGKLQSMGSLTVGHDWATSLSLFMHWRRKWQPTPVFLPGESQGWGSLVGCHLWGHTESDMTEVT